MSTANGLLKIGAFAKLVNTNLRTLRYYEELGLLAPAERSEGGFRYYRPTDVNRVRLIWQLQKLGLPLEQIAELLGNYRSEAPRPVLMQRVRKALARHDDLLKERIRSLRTQRSELAASIETLGSCEHCRQTPNADNNYCEPCVETGDSLPDSLSALF